MIAKFLEGILIVDAKIWETSYLEKGISMVLGCRLFSDVIKYYEYEGSPL